MLAELFEQLPERGDADKPKMVFFFDEAHLLFDRAPRALLDKIEQVVRLIRSKCIGIYFISQSPMDIPQAVLGQLGLKVQHALRAENFPDNPQLDTAAAITDLGIGEALVSVLDDRGSPSPVQRTLIRPPASQIGPLDHAALQERIQRSPFAGRYQQMIDRESAFEILKARADAQAEAAAAQQDHSAQPPSRNRRQSPAEAFVTSAARAIGSQLGRQLMRGLLGSLFGGRR